jgi:hypothetical protein
MFLITSAAYIGSELKSEFGALPPAFLPVGNKRLFHHQLAKIPSSEKVVLTLPESFVVGPFDQAFLQQHNVELLFLPEHLGLGESVVYAINLLALEPTEPLFILHGDTLLNELPLNKDCLYLGKVEDNYNWAEFNPDTGQLSQYNAFEAHGDLELVANGFFSFSAPKKLVKHITRNQWDFIEGINDYHKEIHLCPCVTDTWYDFGHSHTYYNSKSSMTTQRAFNEMKIMDRVVTKISSKKNKLFAEANWFSSLPYQLKHYAPQLLNSKDHDNKFEYSIEYLPLTVLNELYVFSKLPAFAWRKIINACCKFIQQTQQYQIESSEHHASLNELFQKKTELRLNDLFSTNQTIPKGCVYVNNIEKPSLRELASLSSQYLPLETNSINIIHGDLCFSNILYDFRAGSIKVIDPRGLDLAERASLYGNSFYDIAKLAHSIMGLYDLIVAGYFYAKLVDNNLTFSIAQNESRDQVMAFFSNQISEQFNVSKIELYAMQIHLFISMLPLHADRPDRQLGFIGNAYRLYDQLIKALK